MTKDTNIKEKDSKELDNICDECKDKHESVSASIDYAVASGVTATVGYTDVQNTDNGAQAEANGGSAWYVGASISF